MPEAIAKGAPMTNVVELQMQHHRNLVGDLRPDAAMRDGERDADGDTAMRRLI